MTVPDTRTDPQTERTPLQVRRLTVNEASQIKRRRATRDEMDERARFLIGYHHVSSQHLKRYLAEFDFRYNERAGLGIEDRARTERALRGIVGKRLMYRDSPPVTDA